MVSQSLRALPRVRVRASTPGFVDDAEVGTVIYPSMQPYHVASKSTETASVFRCDTSDADIRLRVLYAIRTNMKGRHNPLMSRPSEHADPEIPVTLAYGDAAHSRTIIHGAAVAPGEKQ
jgi:hypothetical protein